jgi:uncharacterized protein YciI
MWYVIMAFDGSTGAVKREEYYSSHRAHVSKSDVYRVVVFLSGPLVGDDGLSPIGSLFIVEAESRSDVEKFNSQDPFTINGIWSKSIVLEFLRKR